MSTDITQIKQLQSKYAHRVDRGSAAEVAALFAENAILRPRYDGDYECKGRAEFERWYAFYHENFRAGVRHLKHMIMSAEVEVTGNNAHGCSYLLATAVSNESNEGFYVTGTYNDEFVRIDGEWLFSLRVIDVEWMAATSALVEEFPPLNFPAKK